METKAEIHARIGKLLTAEFKYLTSAGWVPAPNEVRPPYIYYKWICNGKEIDHSRAIEIQRERDMLDLATVD